VVSYHDPFVPETRIAGEPQTSVELSSSALAESDAVVILTPHPGIDVQAIVNVAPLVFDARGATYGIESPNVVRL
jgi:UDP-N-acetyl-D-glucosamine dehydrogenase